MKHNDPQAAYQFILNLGLITGFVVYGFPTFMALWHLLH
jgi:hypothetical protein